VPDRFARQRILPGVGDAGQARLSKSRVLVVGLGGLGCPAVQYLAGAGVGHLMLVDFDRVEVTNLHRQPLYADQDVGKPKVEAAARWLAAHGSTNVSSRAVRVDRTNAAQLVASQDIVLDCTDDVEARYALSDACAAARVPLVHGAVTQFDGEVAVLCGGEGPCYRCLYPDARQGPSCADEGVLPTVPGIVGTMQAQEALKVLLGLGQPLAGRMLILDGLEGTTRTVELMRRPGCKAHVEDGASCPMPWNAPHGPDISVQDYETNRAEFFLLDVREPDEFEEMAMPHATLIPLGQLRGRIGELPRDKTIVCMCAVGGRSGRSAEFLRAQGFHALNLRGGIRAWLALTRA
jgi:molybdopterin/thiamine biosynthesis adenylyltransferase/rhodanese-related sulfurtransferase